jgi:hypothetical protein
MGTFHDNLGPLHGLTVVVDTEGALLVVGRCHQVTQTSVILHDADVFEDGAGGLSKEQYLKRAAKVGAFPRHPTVKLPLHEVTSISLLGEIPVE